MGYILLAMTILAEATAVILMKFSEGFRHKWILTSAIAVYLLGFILLTLALKWLPVGTANAIWAGASTVLVAVAGIWLFGEQLSTVQWVSMLLIIIGIAGMHLGAPSGTH